MYPSRNHTRHRWLDGRRKYDLLDIIDHLGRHVNQVLPGEARLGTLQCWRPVKEPAMGRESTSQKVGVVRMGRWS